MTETWLGRMNAGARRHLLMRENAQPPPEPAAAEPPPIKDGNDLLRRGYLGSRSKSARTGELFAQFEPHAESTPEDAAREFNTLLRGGRDAAS